MRFRPAVPFLILVLVATGAVGEDVIDVDRRGGGRCRHRRR